MVPNRSSYRDVAGDLELATRGTDKLAYHLVDGGQVHLEPVVVLGERRLDHFDLLFQHVQAGHCRWVSVGGGKRKTITCGLLSAAVDSRLLGRRTRRSDGLCHCRPVGHGPCPVEDDAGRIARGERRTRTTSE